MMLDIQHVKNVDVTKNIDGVNEKVGDDQETTVIVLLNKMNLVTVLLGLRFGFEGTKVQSQELSNEHSLRRKFTDATWCDLKLTLWK